MFCYFGALWNSTESGLSFRRTRRQSRCAVVDLQIPICQWLIMLYSQLIYIYVCDNIIDVIYVLQHSCDFSEVKPTMNGVDPCLLFASGSKGRSFPKAKGGPFPWQKVDRSGHASAVVSVFQGSRWCLLVDISRYSCLFLSGLKQPVQPLSPGSSPQCGRILCQDVLGGDMAPFGATCSCWNKWCRYSQVI